MRNVFGLISLVIVLGVIGVAVRQQMKAARVPAPSSVIAPASGASGAVTLPVDGGASSAKQFQSDMKDALQKQADQRGEGDGGR